uniref:Zmp:0000000936 n=1 Tax=Neogobius melanostomus TaxID=47308 RepID=A0A8C6TGV7_9GOBI
MTLMFWSGPHLEIYTGLSFFNTGKPLPDECKNYGRRFQRVYSVPGDVAMVNSTLLSYSFFNLSAEPYNVTWYRLGSDQPISNQSGRVLVVRETLWFLNVTLADDGNYVTVVRTPRQCFRLETVVVVDMPLSQCGRPRTTGQDLTKRVTDILSCPLKEFISKLRQYGISYDITWYKGCEQISDGAGRLHYWDTFLKVERVESADQGLYTCTLHFNMGGVRRHVSETIDAVVKGDYYLLPQINEPAKDFIRAELGSNVTKRCLVFVPCEGNPYLNVNMYWLKRDVYISDDPSQRIYMTQERSVSRQDEGVLIDRWLVISELKEEDLNLNYTCIVFSGRGIVDSYFTLLYKEPELLVPVGLVLGSCLLLFLLCVSVYHVFKLELVLWFRQTFPMLYSRSGPDGKLYDAYVAFPQRCTAGWTLEVERFALHTLPQVLEEACGYSLFIPDRDSLPGEAVTDSVEENLKVSRRIILLYTASTFSHNTSQMDINTTNNHLNSRMVHFCPSEDPNNDSPQSCEDTCGHARTQLECMAAMHRALLERSLKVILVELEELGPSDLEQLPQSVRHLRQIQGAVCWWRTRVAAGTPCMTGCTHRTWDTETTLLSPNCRFWKEVRYRMPVKGKRTTPPEDTALLHQYRTETRTQGQHTLPV